MNKFPEAELRTLWQTISRLLAPEGCPWDREQSATDIAGYLIEEGHEWLESCRNDDLPGQVDELGDVNYLAMFGLLNLAARNGGDVAAPLRTIDAKLKRRHPQLFPADPTQQGEAAASSEEQLAVWEEIKRRERSENGESANLLKPLPASLGALIKSQRYQERAAGVGFDWPDLDGVLAKMEEELGELRSELRDLPGSEVIEAGKGSPSKKYRRALAERDLSRLSDEIGDILFVLVNLCRWLGLDADRVAEGGNDKFLRRFSAMENSLRSDGHELTDVDLEEMESHWVKVKQRERNSGS